MALISETCNPNNRPRRVVEPKRQTSVMRPAQMLYVVFLRLPFVMPEDGLAEVIMDQAEKLKGFVTIVSALPYKAVVALVGSTIAFGSTMAPS